MRVINGVLIEPHSQIHGAVLPLLIDVERVGFGSGVIAASLNPYASALRVGIRRFHIQKVVKNRNIR